MSDRQIFDDDDLQLDSPLPQRDPGNVREISTSAERKIAHLHATPPPSHSSGMGRFLLLIGALVLVLFGGGYAHKAGWLKPSEDNPKPQPLQSRAAPIVGDTVELGDLSIRIKHIDILPDNESGEDLMVVAADFACGTDASVLTPAFSVKLLDAAGTEHSPAKEGGQFEPTITLFPDHTLEHAWGFRDVDIKAAARILFATPQGEVSIDLTRRTPENERAVAKILEDVRDDIKKMLAIEVKAALVQDRSNVRIAKEKHDAALLEVHKLKKWLNSAEANLRSAEKSHNAAASNYEQKRSDLEFLIKTAPEGGSATALSHQGKISTAEHNLRIANGEVERTGKDQIKHQARVKELSKELQSAEARLKDTEEMLRQANDANSP